MKKYLSNIGFSALEAILIVAVLGLLAFVGWTSIQNKNKNKASMSQPTTPVSKPSDKEAIQYVSFENKNYSVSYPKDWRNYIVGGDDLQINSPDYEGYGLQVPSPKTGAQIYFSRTNTPIGDSVDHPKLENYNGASTATKRGKVKIGDKEAYQFEYTEKTGQFGFSGEVTLIYYSNGTKLDVFYTYSLQGDKYREVYNHVLESIKLK